MNILEQGYGIVPKLAIEDSRLTTTSKAIYSLLCVFKGDDDIATPKRETIMNYLKIGSKNTYYKHLKLLVDFGYIEVEQCFEVNKFTSNNYIILNKIKTENEVVDVNKKGFSIVPRKMIQDTNLSLVSKVIYVFIAGYKKDSHPGIKHIKSSVGIKGETTLFNALSELETYGYVLRENNKVQGKFETSTYKLIGYDEAVDEELVERLEDKLLCVEEEKRKKERKNKKKSETVVSDERETNKKERAKQRRVIRKRQRVISEKEEFNKNFARAEKVLRKNLMMDNLDSELEKIKNIPKNKLSNEQLLLIEEHQFFTQSINLMLDNIFAKSEEIKIGKNKVNRAVLSELFFNITYDTLYSVYNAISLNLGNIKDYKSYTLVAIYNAITTPNINKLRGGENKGEGVDHT